MTTKLPGLLCEKLPSGTYRYRVRKEGDKYSRITLTASPSDPDFFTQYKAARLGIKPETSSKIITIAPKGSIKWLADMHIAWLTTEVEHGNQSWKTLKKRKMMLKRLTSIAGDHSLDVPKTEIFKFRDLFSNTPVMADDMVAAIRVMYDWGIERGHCEYNPAKGIKNFGRKGTGAVPWSKQDLKKFKLHHPPGSMAHLAITLLAFTACRIGDARILGHHNEVVRDNITYLEWQPEKRGASFVSIPMMPQLAKAIRDARVVGPKTYLVSSKGKPFSSADAISQRFSKWCREAGLENRTAHGIRKAVGHILAEAGCTQYQIMAIHGHSESRTSEVYTRAVERPELARQAIFVMNNLEW